jgi:hypothetical protein
MSILVCFEVKSPLIFFVWVLIWSLCVEAKETLEYASIYSSKC